MISALGQSLAEGTLGMRALAGSSQERATVLESATAQFKLLSCKDMIRGGRGDDPYLLTYNHAEACCQACLQ